jgi:hypothetical protein
MKCDRCGSLIKKGEEMEYHGQILCEDCYMDALSPARACDPWAVYTAKSLSGEKAMLNEIQVKILKVLEETGGVKADILAEILHIELSDLEREIATLRHMEKVRAKMKDGKKVICLW